MKDAPLLHRLEYVVFRLANGGMRGLSHAGARRLGAAFGDLAYAVLGERRRRALANLGLAFPEAAPALRRRWARQSFRTLGAHLCDTLSAARFDAVTLCERWTLAGWEHVDAGGPAAPAVLMSAHLGFWEMSGQPIGLYKGTLTAISRPLDNPHLEREIQRLRRRFGVRMVAKRHAARAMLRAIDAGEHLFLLIDQRPGRSEEAVEVPLFGWPARATPVLARLARRFALPVVPLFAFPEPGGRYQIVARPPIPADAADETELTARYLAAVEAEVRRRPGEWMWMHDRWRPG